MAFLGPYVDGYQSSDYVKNGNAIGVPIGNIAAGDTVKVTYEVMISSGVQKTIWVDWGKFPLPNQIKENTITLTNIAQANGQNGSVGATDSSVKVPPVVKVDPTTIPDDPSGGDLEEPTITKTTQKTVVDLTADPTNVYTIKLENTTDKIWENVKVVDYLVSSRTTLYADSVKVDGVARAWGSGYVYTLGATQNCLEIPIGDMKPGATRTITFKLRFASDGASYKYDNRATATSDNYDDIFADATPIVMSQPMPTTDDHQKLFSGYSVDGQMEWWPTMTANAPYKYLSLEEACAVIARGLTAEQRSKLLNGRSLTDAISSLSDAWPKNEWYGKPVCFMGAIKAVSLEDVTYGGNKQLGRDYEYAINVNRMVATRYQLGKMLKTCGYDLTNGGIYDSTDPTIRTARQTFAGEMCRLLNRDTTPNTNNKTINVFTDTASSTVTEVSIWHTYVLDGDNNEIWTSSDPNHSVDI